MATTTEQIMKAARALGEQIAQHPAAAKFHQVVEKLEKDVEAQRVMADYQRLIQKLGEKEAQGQPIEVSEKRQVEQLQGSVMRNPLLQQLQMAQMDYLDLMRQVDEAISGDTGGGAEHLATPAGPGAPGPIRPA